MNFLPFLPSLLVAFLFAAEGAHSEFRFFQGEGFVLRTQEQVFETVLEWSDGTRTFRLNTPGTTLLGDPAVDGDRAAWIEQGPGTSRVLLRSGSQTQVLFEAGPGRCLDVALGKAGVAWSVFFDSDWDIAFWKEGRMRIHSMPGSDEVIPAVGDNRVAWISSSVADVWASVSSPLSGEPERLPGWFASGVRFEGGRLSWVAREGAEPVFYLNDDLGSRQVSGDASLLDWFEADSEPAEIPPLRNPSVEWKRSDTTLSPWPRASHSTVGLKDGRTLVFDGEVENPKVGRVDHLGNELWAFDRADSDWRRIDDAAGPSPRCHASLAYDSSREQLLLWAGGGWTDRNRLEPLGDTWSFDLATRQWRQLRPPASPPAGSNAGLVYVPNQDRFLLYHHGEVWSYDPREETWTLVPTGDSPPPRTCSALLLDASRNRLILFGGALHPRYFGDTWVLDLDTLVWREIRTARHPDPRVRSALAVDPVGDRVLLYGGERGPSSRTLADLWALDLETEDWILLENDNPDSPGPRGGFLGTAFDKERGVLTLFGGRSDTFGYHNDTWELRVRP